MVGSFYIDVEFEAEENGEEDVDHPDYKGIHTN